MKLSRQLKAVLLPAVLIAVLCVGHKAFADTAATTSANWGGYIAQNGIYTGVSGTWTIPTIAPSATLTSNATWVGIGGRTSNDLIQAGVYEIANSDGVSYQAWYELLPDNSIPIDMTVTPGDSISVAIIETSQNIWNIVITDNTTQQQFEKTVMYQSSLSSAEWVQERPVVNQTFSSLSGFSPVVFSGATAVQGGQHLTLAQTDPTMINLIDTTTNTALAVPTPIQPDTMSFSVMRTSATTSSSSDSTLSPQPSISQYTIPPFELHRTGHSIGWVLQFGLEKI